MNLHLLGCPDDDFTGSGKCLSKCMWQKFYAKCSSRINAKDFTNLYIKNYPTINCCLSTFEGSHSKDGAVFTLFPEFSE